MNWPWPLDGVQAWFESLWDWIGEAAFNAVKQLWDWITESFKSLESFITQKIEWIYSELSKINYNIESSVKSTVEWIWNQIKRTLESAAGQIAVIYSYVTDFIKKSLDSLLSLAQIYLKKTWEKLYYLSNYIQNSFYNTISYILNNIKKISETTQVMVQKGFEWINEQLIDPLIDWLKELIAWLKESFSKFIEELSKMFSNLINELTKQANNLANFLRNLWTELGKIAEKDIKPLVTGLINELSNTIHKLLADALFKHSPITPDEAVQRSMMLILGGSGAFIGYAIGSILVETMTAGQLDYTLSIIGEIPALQALQGAATDCARYFLDYGLGPALRRAILRDAVPMIPEIRDLIYMFNRGLLSKEDTLKYIREHGFEESWGEKLIEISYRLPSEADLREMMWRGLISEEDYKKNLEKQGYHPDFLDKYVELSKKIPGASDLITFVVREVITPEDFTKYMKYQGFDEMWSKAYWEAHWKLPSFENIREAFWRGIVTEEEFKKYIVWHDYKPEPRPGISKSDQEIMLELSYKLPGRIDARWMYEWNVISEEELRQLLKMDGLHPDWIDKVKDAYVKNIFRDELSRIRSAAERLFRDGYISERELREILTKLGYRNEIIEYTVWWAKLERDRETKELLEKIYLEAFEKGKISREELIRYLMDLGMDAKLAELKATLKELQLAPKPKPPKEVTS